MQSRHCLPLGSYTHSIVSPTPVIQSKHCLPFTITWILGDDPTPSQVSPSVPSWHMIHGVGTLPLHRNGPYRHSGAGHMLDSGWRR